MLTRPDPGLCPICGAEHAACTSSTGPLMVVQLPARDEGPSVVAVPLVAETVQESLPEGLTTTGTYRGRVKR